MHGNEGVKKTKTKIFEKLVFGAEHSAILVLNVRHSLLTFQLHSSTYRLYS